MALLFAIPGAIKIEVGIGSAGAYATLGYCSRENLPDFTDNHLRHEVKSDDYGDEVAEVVHLGRSGLVTFGLAHYDPAILIILKTQPGAGDTGGGSANDEGAGVIGTSLFAAEDYFRVKLTPTIVGQKGYEFTRVWTKEGAVRIAQMGNREQIVHVTLQAKRNETTHNLYEAFTVA